MKKFRVHVALFTALALLLSMTGLAGASDAFTDVDSTHEASASFDLLADLGIFLGYGDGTVGPDDPITREQFAAVVIRSQARSSTAAALANLPTDFTDDASISSWARGYVVLAHARGIINGYPDNSFQPQGLVTFAETFAMLSRSLGLDAAASGPWPANYLGLANEIGLDVGVDVIANAPVNRSEMAIASRSSILSDWAWVVTDGVGELEEAGDGSNSLFVTRLGMDEDDWSAETGDTGTVAGAFDRTNAAGDIVVDGTAYAFSDDYADADDLYLNTSKADITDLDDLVEDDEVELTLNADGEVTKVEVTRITQENELLSVATVDTDETDFGDVTVNSVPYEVTDDTEIVLNGSAATMADLAAAFEAFQDKWDDSDAVATLRTVGNDAAATTEATYISVITSTTVAGEITAKGADADGDYVRIDGDKYYYDVDPGDVEDEVTVLLGHDDEIYVVLDEGAADDTYYAEVLGYELDGDDINVDLRLADGSETTLTVDASFDLNTIQGVTTSTTHESVVSSALNGVAVVLVDESRDDGNAGTVASGDAVIYSLALIDDDEVSDNFTNTDDTDDFISAITSSYISVGGVTTSPYSDEGLLVWDEDEEEVIARSDLEVDDNVVLYRTGEGLSGFVLLKADQTAPTVTSATFTNATTLVIVFNEAVNAVVGDFTNGTHSGAGAQTFTVDAIAGSGTATITLTVTGSDAIATGDTGTVDIGAGVADLAGNAITAVDDQAIAAGF